MTLAKWPVQTWARITRIDVADQFDLRLSELGIRPGARFVTVNKAAFGGRVINISGTRIAVDHRSARAIHVEASDGQ